MQITAVRGTRDILPDEAKKWRYVENIARQTFEIFGYEEIKIPTFEQTELFVRGVGEATDLVQKEMYTFADKKGRSLTLRPEGTASVVRACIEHNLCDGVPLRKLYYIGQMFRYERPQAGRYREFWQLGAEALGSPSPALDAEIIALTVHLLERLGMGELGAEINSIGCRVCRPIHLIELKAFLESKLEQLCVDCKRRYETNPLRVFDCKEPSCKSVLIEAPKTIDWLCESCKSSFESVKSHLEMLNIPYIVNPFIVRGFDYYTKTAFETFSKSLGAQNAILGGGRYDYLAEELGGKPTPGVGFAAGLDRIVEVIESQNINLPIKSGIDLYIANLGERAFEKSVAITNSLRKNGFSVEVNYDSRSLKSQLKSADKLVARFVVIIGDNEMENGVAILKDMRSGEQETVRMEELEDRLRAKGDMQ
jgi:histidyl-tRNA synthetase